MKEFIKENERIFEAKVKLKYLLIENKYSNKLLVTFSGYSHDLNIRASYNYINCVEKININKLYILDDFAFENRGCWYIGESGGNEVEESVMLLIVEITLKKGILWENVIFTGSSKGGFAALYLGIKYNVANIIAGAPQILLGDYLKMRIDVLESINGNMSEAGIEKLNNIILKEYIWINTKVYIVCGKNDEHLTEHIIPFYKANIKNENIKFIIINGNHETLWFAFSRKMPKILKDVITNQTSKNYLKLGSLYFQEEFSIHNYKGIIDSSFIDIEVESDNKLKIYGQVINENIMYSSTLLLENSVVKSYEYQDEPYFEFEIENLDEHNYYIVWKIKDAGGNEEDIKVLVDNLDKEEESVYSENIFHGVKDIKYLLSTEYSSSNLLIVFSTYTNDKNEKNSFSYIETFEHLKCNKLFILDDHGYNNKGCWFLGEEGKLTVEKSIISLIRGIIKTLSVRSENIILMGLGNGGFASLYYGLKYKFNNIVAIEPQIFLGKHLKGNEDVVGGILGKKCK